MKHFWALPALLRPALVLASQHSFSVHDDILAFPQFEVHFSEDYISEEQAQLQLQKIRQADTERPSDIGQYSGRTTRDNDGNDHHDGAANEEKLEYEIMTQHNQRYLCSIPQVEKPADQPRESDTASKAEQEKELARANDRGWELLSGMQGKCIYYMSGWWSYRFCYNDEVKQFHQLPPSRGMPVYPPVEDPNTQGFLLGRYEEKKQDQDGSGHSEEKWEGEGALEVSERATRKMGGHGELVTRGENRYLKSEWHGGTECDLTGKERRIEVQYHCNPSIGADRIHQIKETSTCAYLMVVHTPRLCDDVAFQPPQEDAAHSISCTPILEPEEAETFKREQKAYKSALQEAQIWEANPDAAAAFGLLGDPSDDEPPMQLVGDIIVGGHDIVPEGVKIEKSGIVGGKDKYIDTIANSWGKTLSKEELKKLGLDSSRAIENLEKLKKEVEQRAKGEKWKVVVVDTPRGREYRGIFGKDVGDDDEVDAGTSQKQGKGQEESEGSSQGKQGGSSSDGDGVDGAQEGSEEEYFKEEL